MSKDGVFSWSRLEYEPDIEGCTINNELQGPPATDVFVCTTVASCLYEAMRTAHRGNIQHLTMEYEFGEAVLIYGLID